MLFKRYTCVRQRDISDCGAACLATIALQYGLKKSVAIIRDLAGTNTAGTTAYGLVQAARQMGFMAKGVKGTIDQLDGNIPLPAVAHIVRNNIQHYVVIHKIGKNSLLIADPAEGLKEQKKSEFAGEWSGVLILMLPDVNFQRGDEVKGLERLLALLFPHKKLISEILTASLLHILLGMGGAFYFKFLLDDVLAGGLENTLHSLSIGMAILILFRVLLNAFRRHILLYMSQKIDVSLIFTYYQHVLKLPLTFFDTRRTGEILSRLVDATKIRNALSSATLSVLIDTFMVLVGGVVLYLQSATLFWVTLLFIPFSLLIVWLFTKPFRRIQRKQMSQAADTEAYLVESLAGVATVKSQNAQEEAVYETEKRFIRYLRYLFRGSWMQNIQFSLQDFFTLLGGLVILWVGGMEVIKGNMTIGQLITFNALLAYFYTPIQNLIRLQPQLLEALVAQERLTEILDIKQEAGGENGLLAPESLQGEIRFEQVSYSYREGEPVLADISFSIAPGELLSIVGESGSGKSTLAKLLVKFYPATQGDIFINNINLKDLQTGALRERIGYVPQDVFLFSGSVKENIAFGRKQAGFQEIIDAAEAAGAHQFINTMPLRYDTLIGERGSTLSGGQKQRIALARVFLKNPDILILDEATSHLDAATEKAIYAHIEKLQGRTTVIIIAHRLNSLMKSSRIILLDKGRISETGTHAQLLRQQGKYAALWQEQTEGDIRL